MKLASLKHGRDGQLVVVSRDLSRYIHAKDVAPTLQAALDDWANARLALEELAQRVEAGEGEAFDEAMTMLSAEHRVGMSIGVSHTHLSRPVNAHDLVSHADEALYAAKASVRNRVMVRGRHGIAAPLPR